MTGAEYIAAFLAAVGSDKVFVLNGGACAFMVDAVDRHPALRCVPFQHEQAAAMAADAVWRVSRRVGVTMATSGPGATNLITGIACSYFDSIPSLHITGQVNQRESSSIHNAKVRQSGFQETKIVEMVRPITKRCTLVRTTAELREELARSYLVAVSDRKGPVLIDVPMDVQQADVEGDLLLPEPETTHAWDHAGIAAVLRETLGGAERPVVLWGAGIALAGVETQVADWLRRSDLPFVASWGGLPAFPHDHPGYLGQIGVYGNRGANFVVQNADAVIVLGSRLDNRQRSGGASTFAKEARVHVLDVDAEELEKYHEARYVKSVLDFRELPAVLSDVSVLPISNTWRVYVSAMRERYFGKEASSTGSHSGGISPYDVVRRLNDVIDQDAIVVSDTGAAVCWLHQAFHIKQHCFFTSGGNSPMGYALPAAIGAKLSAPHKQVVSYNGDGGFQLNLQELQTLRLQKIDVSIIVMNNSGYGIISQFQDSYCRGRHSASREGCTSPDLRAIASAYGLRYVRIEHINQIDGSIFGSDSVLIEVILNEATLIEPKLEMGRPINDQYPYLTDREYEDGNRFVSYPR